MGERRLSTRPSLPPASTSSLRLRRVDRSEPVEVLLVEDNPGDAGLVRARLRKVANITHVETLEDALAELRVFRPDAIMCDLNLPDSDGLDTLTALKSRASQIPIIVLTGSDDEELGLDAMALGAEDFLPKSELRGRAVERALRYAVERARQRAEVVNLAQRLVDAVVVVDEEGRFAFVNSAAEALFGQPAAKLLDREFEQSLELGEIALTELTRLDGTRVPVELHASRIRWQGQRATLATLRDVSVRDAAERERRALEGQLRQAQKLEAIGRLAGGLAHDFNNVLLVISSHAEIAMDELGLRSPVREELRAILGATARATALTKQLLTVSKRHRTDPRPLSLNELIRGATRLFARTLGEHINLRLVLDESIEPVSLDPSFAEQVVLNLVINARDAMPDGGELWIGTERATGKLASGYEGEVVRMTLRDTGVGMSPEVTQRAFEPFFTTKDAGAGSGLGLAMCYGIVTEAGGEVRIESEPGVGTSVEVVLPVASASAEAAASERTAPRKGGPLRMLLVEDDEGVRHAVSRMLRTRGHTVFSASTLAEAVEVASVAKDLDILLSDVVMPDHNGREVAEAVRRVRPGLPVLFMSGYAPEEALAHLEEGEALICKPFSPEELALALSELTNRSVTSSGTFL